MLSSTVRRKMATDNYKFTHNSLAYEENPKNAHKNAHKSSKTFKPSIHSSASTGTNVAKHMAFHVPIGCVSRLARYFCKMHGNRHLFFRTADWLKQGSPSDIK